MANCYLIAEVVTSHPGWKVLIFNIISLLAGLQVDLAVNLGQACTLYSAVEGALPFCYQADLVVLRCRSRSQRHCSRDSRIPGEESERTVVVIKQSVFLCFWQNQFLSARFAINLAR